MSKILKRPMFKMGGTPNEGIMHGLVKRQGYDTGGPAEKYADEYFKMLSKYKPPAPKLPIGQIGLNLVSGEYAGDGLLSNIARSAKGPYEQFTQADDATRNIDYQTKMAAAKMGISRAEAERIAMIKAKKDSNNLQKDYTPQRAYETAVAERVKSASELKSFQKPNLEQKYPRATAEYDTYILRNLRSTTDETGRMINANNQGFVPFNQKDQTFDYSQMLPGAFYYDPRIKAFVQRIPEGDPDAGIYIYDKNTYQKRKYEPGNN